jgi:hypothetical protein
MATLVQLTEKGKLKEYVVELEPSQQPERYVYAAPEVEEWFANVLSQAARDLGRNLWPYEQVEGLLHDFVAGEILVHTDTYRQLEPLYQSVWELRTVDVRIFGWFPRRCTFLMVCGALKKTIPRARDYRPFIQRVLDFRATLPLDEPKAVIGGFRDVL